MVVTRGTKEADSKKKNGKANKTVATTSMKKQRRKTLLAREMDAYSMFMITDFLKRYYQNHPRSTTGLIPDDAEKCGFNEWINMSESEKASWIENVNNMKAGGKTLFQLRCEYYYLY
ncbi:uncharacterized protein LOC141693460 [Apium graveolens]|uniref:uncharacterized protein LOC141693460 n=1 Tax=Apium graveolens TaxID=4045 RepID=UPI003D791DAB